VADSSPITSKFPRKEKTKKKTNKVPKKGDMHKERDFMSGKKEAKKIHRSEEVHQNKYQITLLNLRS